MAYTKEEIEAFAAKDRLNAMQSALKAAATNNEGLGKPKEDVVTEAKFYYGALMEAKNGKHETESEKKIIPRPTQQQHKILKKVAEQAGVDVNQVIQRVYWKYGKYPTQESSIEKIINELFGEQK